MASDDFFMRQIEGIGDMLSMLLFDKTASENMDVIYDTQISTNGHSLLIDLRFLITQEKMNEAENLLFQRMEQDSDSSYLHVAAQFYGWLAECSDEELAKSNYSREEIDEGRKAVWEFHRAHFGGTV